MRFTVMPSPVGELTIAGDDRGLRHIRFASGRGAGGPESDWERDDASLRTVLLQLEAYFAGELRDFDLAIAPAGTEFQRRVWCALADIPYGETVSYGTLARRVGRPTAARAVGAANGANPLPIVLPCHRVIGANGSLVGYGGGLEIKVALLEHEQRWGGQARLFEPDAVPPSATSQR